jgi:phenylpropionate dioxygenase-like ring-hydroxylating dioxygenase large terminal subunit
MDVYAVEHPLSRNPKGWYAVALSSEVAPGVVLPISCAGQDLVVFRTDNGVLSVLDAYCAHHGAHLGYGGKVDGECLRCPFHNWAYGTDGNCVDIPYTKKIPPRARTRRYPAVERNGAILTWFAEDGSAPDFEIPEFPHEGWSTPTWFELVLPLHIQEIAENGIDIAHFSPIHRSTRAEATVLDPKGVPFHFWLKTAYEGDGIGVPGTHVNVATEWRYYGLGLFLASPQLKTSKRRFAMSSTSHQCQMTRCAFVSR